MEPKLVALRWKESQKQRWNPDTVPPHSLFPIVFYDRRRRTSSLSKGAIGHSQAVRPSPKHRQPSER